MGHRCNYVVRRGGERTLYASNWGALTVIRDFFWGLGPSLAFLEGEAIVPEDDGWYDDVFGEGAAAIDFDERVVAVNGHDLWGPARELALRMMQVVWKPDGFTVRDSPTVADLATQVGAPAEWVEAPYFPRGALDVDAAAHDARLYCVAHVDDEIRFCRSHEALLELGAEELPSLRRLPSLAEALALAAADDDDRSLGRRWLTVVRIDSAKRELGIPRYDFRRGPSRRFFQERWPGWQIRPIESSGDYLRNLALPGLDVPDAPPPPTFDEQLARIEGYLFSDNEHLDRIYAMLEDSLDEGGMVNPLALHRSKLARPGTQLARETFERAKLACLPS